MSSIRRKNYFPLPALQIQLVVVCLFFAACAGMIEGILVQRFVTELLLELPESSEISKSAASTWVMRQFLISIVVLFPFVLGFGVLITFRYAGPLVNIERHLRRIAAGEDPGPCRLRKEDHFQQLADAVNLAVATLNDRIESGARPSVPAESALETAAPKLS